MQDNTAQPHRSIMFPVGPTLVNRSEAETQIISDPKDMWTLQLGLALIIWLGSERNCKIESNEYWGSGTMPVSAMSHCMENQGKGPRS